MLESGNFTSPERRTTNNLPKKEKLPKPDREESLEQTMPGVPPEKTGEEPNVFEKETIPGQFDTEDVPRKEHSEVPQLSPEDVPELTGVDLTKIEEEVNEPENMKYVRDPLSNKKITDPVEQEKMRERNIKREAVAIKNKILKKKYLEKIYWSDLKRLEELEQIAKTKKLEKAEAAELEKLKGLKRSIEKSAKDKGLESMVSELSEDEKAERLKEIEEAEKTSENDPEIQMIKERIEHGIPDETGTVHILTKPEYTEETGIKPSEVENPTREESPVQTKNPLRRFWDKLRAKK